MELIERYDYEYLTKQYQIDGVSEYDVYIIDRYNNSGFNVKIVTKFSAAYKEIDIIVNPKEYEEIPLEYFILSLNNEHNAYQLNLEEYIKNVKNEKTLSQIEIGIQWLKDCCDI